MPRTWIPRVAQEGQIHSLKLSPRDGFVLSRVDGATDLDGLAQVTGLAPEELRPILDRLVTEGALQPPPPTASDPRDGPSAIPPRPMSEGVAATHRQLFESRFHPRPEDERAARAATADDPDLSALCFDPVPAVIHRVLENPRTGLAHARLIAAHHRNPVGLTALAARVAFTGDREVQRLLLRNTQSPETVVKRLLASRRLAEVYESCLSHELPERHRLTARSVLRGRFAAAPPEERVDLIVSTDGRALASLTGQALDGRSVALLCARTLSSTLLIENLARWPATPPTLVGHLLKQPLVRQAPTLKQLLRRHPNCPRSEP